MLISFLRLNVPFQAPRCRFTCKNHRGKTLRLRVERFASQVSELAYVSKLTRMAPFGFEHCSWIDRKIFQELIYVSLNLRKYDHMKYTSKR